MRNKAQEHPNLKAIYITFHREHLVAIKITHARI